MSAARIILWFICTLFGGLFPDIDTKSKGQMLFYKLVCLVILFCIIYKAYYVGVMLSFFSFWPLLVKHRGLFHRLWFLLALTGAGCYALLQVLPLYRTDIIACTSFFAVGFISHLYLDMGLKGLLKL
jgi:surface polysaccharide O-acyltransferase-like enzyme